MGPQHAAQLSPRCCGSRRETSRFSPAGCDAQRSPRSGSVLERAGVVDGRVGVVPALTSALPTTLLLPVGASQASQLARACSPLQTGRCAELVAPSTDPAGAAPIAVVPSRGRRRRTACSSSTITPPAVAGTIAGRNRPLRDQHGLSTDSGCRERDVRRILERPVLARLQDVPCQTFDAASRQVRA